MVDWVVQLKRNVDNASVIDSTDSVSDSIDSVSKKPNVCYVSKNPSVSYKAVAGKSITDDAISCSDDATSNKSRGSDSCTKSSTKSGTDSSAVSGAVSDSSVVTDTVDDTTVMNVADNCISGVSSESVECSDRDVNVSDKTSVYDSSIGDQVVVSDQVGVSGLCIVRVCYLFHSSWVNL